jgi:hypothetical protein
MLPEIEPTTRADLVLAIATADEAAGDAYNARVRVMGACRYGGLFEHKADPPLSADEIANADELERKAGVAMTTALNRAAELRARLAALPPENHA